MKKQTLSGTLLDEKVQLSLKEISLACSSRIEWVLELVDEGIIEPCGPERSDWRFPGNSLARAHMARRLQHDLDINLAGVALVLDLLQEIDTLRSRLRVQKPLNE